MCEPTIEVCDASFVSCEIEHVSNATIISMTHSYMKDFFTKESFQNNQDRK